MSGPWAIRGAWPECTPERAALWSAYEAVSRDGAGPADEQLAGLARDARARSDAALVCDVTTVRALRALVHEDLPAATELARTASRMARTEALHASECFASIVLARTRRLNGEPHRAMRIASALLGYAEAPFHEWIEWELGLTTLDGTPRWPRSSALRVARAHVQRGERLAAAAAVTELGDGSVLRRQDLAVLAASCGLTAPTTPREVVAWQRGERTDLPWGLAGLAEAEQPVHVVAAPGRVALRVLDTGLALHEPLARLPATPGPQHRSDALLAALGLAGPQGAHDAPLFESVYGFAFVRATHQGVLDVLVHRARARIGALGRVDRVADGYVLVPAQAVAIPDPRSAPRDDDRVLRLVASSGRLTARDASKTLGVSLRKAQQALDALAGSGACVQVRAGRHFEYRVEDTTFTEPTGVRGGD